MTIQELKQQYPQIIGLKQGGQKVVYRATTKDGTTVALKIINNTSDARVLQEIDIVQKLGLANVPRILETGTVINEATGVDALYIVEELIEGVSLRDWLTKGNTADLATAYKILHTLLAIEVELEKQSILHRDINPNNIILGDNGEVYLIDFGLAKDLEGISLTRSSDPFGPFTPGYAPREQFQNMKPYQDVRTDLFQIGVTVYECCNGKNPFVEESETIWDVLDRTITVMPPALDLPGDTKGMFGQFVNMLMAKNMSQRPKTAEDAMRYLLRTKAYLDLGE